MPEWIPQVRRPWNPAYQEVWDMMTPDEKRSSFLFDCVVIGVVFTLIGIAAAYD